MKVTSVMAAFEINSVAALRNISKIKNKVARTAGYTNPGDGGHGEYWFDAADTTSADNGFTVIVAADGGRWKLQIANGCVPVEQAGAVGDYSFTTDTGTDDYNKIQLALDTAYALGIGRVLAAGKYLVSDTLVIPRGVTLEGAFAVGGENQTGAAVWPPATDVGSTIVGSSTSGPVVLINRSDSWLKDIVLSATQVRNAATITTGAQNINCGLAVETDDTSTASIRRSGAVNVLFMYQPAEGYYIAGAVASLKFENNVSLKCGRHGFAVDCGTLSGRTNKARPGIIKIIGHRSVNLGGHGFVIGDAVSNTASLPYRIDIDEYEGFRCGNNAGYLLRSAHGYIRGTDIRYQQSASVATSGTSGETPTLDHCLSVSGRNINLFDNRYIHYVDEPVEFFTATDLINDGINIFGATLNTLATPLPDNFIKPTNTITNMVVLGVDYTGPVGIAGDLVDFSLFSVASKNIEVWQAGGEILTLRSVRNRVQGGGFYSRILSIADDAASTLNFSGTSFVAVLQIIGSTSARGTAKVHFRVGSAAFATLIDSSGVTVSVGTTALTGTTGADGNLNIAAMSDNRLIIENRTGATANYSLTFISAIDSSGELIHV